MDFFMRFLVAGGIMAIIDAVWLSVVANKFYKSQIGPLLLDKPNFVAATLFYLIYIVGVVVFALSPALNFGNWETALGLGSLFGFVAYATYDLTNLSTLKGFSVKLVVVDMIWGTVLTAAVTTIAYFILQR